MTYAEAEDILRSLSIYFALCSNAIAVEAIGKALEALEYMERMEDDGR